MESKIEEANMPMACENALLRIATKVSAKFSVDVRARARPEPIEPAKAEPNAMACELTWVSAWFICSMPALIASKSGVAISDREVHPGDTRGICGWPR